VDSSPTSRKPTTRRTTASGRRERGNSLLKTTLKALRNVSLCPWKIGKIIAAALVILHIEYNQTT